MAAFIKKKCSSSDGCTGLVGLSSITVVMNVLAILQMMHRNGLLLDLRKTHSALLGRVCGVLQYLRHVNVNDHSEMKDSEAVSLVIDKLPFPE